MHIQPNETTKVIRNFIALAIGQYGGMFFTIIFSITLARLLSPSDFGNVAIVVFSFTFFNWLVEWGWDAAFMAHKEIELQRAASTHFLIRFVLGSVPFFAYLTNPWLVPLVIGNVPLRVVLALALMYWVERVGLTYKTILERQYDLHKVASLEFGATIASYALAVLAAWCGLGVYSLVVQRLVEKSVLSCGYFFYSPWRIGLSFDVAVAKIFFKSFGMATWLGSIFSLTIYDAMPYLIGRLASTHAAGLYEKAFNLGTFPMILTGIASRLTIPLYTKNQFVVPLLRGIFVRAQASKLLVLVPMQLVLAICGPLWIPRVLGPQWAVMVPIYQIMCVYGLFRAFFDDVVPLQTYGFKNPWALTRSQILQSLIIITIGPLCVQHWGAMGGAIAMTIMMVSATILFWRNIFRAIECSAHHFLDTVRTLPQVLKQHILKAKE